MKFGQPPWEFVWFIPMMVALWTASSFFTAKLGGWRRLSTTYRTDEPIVGATWWFQSATLGGWARYGYCLIISVTEEGLRIATVPYFILFHRPLVIPWEDITFSRRHLFFKTEITLHVATQPDIPIHIDNRLANDIQDAIGRRWLEEE